MKEEKREVKAPPPLRAKSRAKKCIQSAPSASSRAADAINALSVRFGRLSRDDEMQGESNSITNQKQLLKSYAKRNGFVNIYHDTEM